MGTSTCQNTGKTRVSQSDSVACTGHHLQQTGPVHTYYVCAQDYFASLGFEVPAHINPADYMMDAVAGAVQPNSGPAVDIAAAWRTRQQGPAGSTAQGAGQQGDADDESAVVAIAASRRTSQQDAKAPSRVSALAHCTSGMWSNMCRSRGDGAAVSACCLDCAKPACYRNI